MKFGHLARSRTMLLAVPLVVAAVAAVAVLAGGEDGRPPAGAATTTSSAPLAGDPTPTSAGTPGGTAPPGAGGTGASASTTGTGTTPATEPAGPAAPWDAAALPRSKVPGTFVTAWERAGNRRSCGLLVPSDAGPEMRDAEAHSDVTPDDAGWDIILRDGGRIVEILGLFTRETQPEEPPSASFSRTWADGSYARYRADDPGSPDGGPSDPEATAFEARLTIPGQDCVYLIYDTLGKSHLEYVLERLRFVEGTR